MIEEVKKRQTAEVTTRVVESGQRAARGRCPSGGELNVREGISIATSTGKRCWLNCFPW